MPIRDFQKDDIEPLRRILEATGFFREDEILVAVELMEIVVEEKDQKDYITQTYVDDANTVRGYYCVGPTPMTTGTYDLYWIAVDPSVQRKGIGRELLKHCEEKVKAEGARLIIAETSSQDKYQATRLYYERNNFTMAAHIRDYYAAGDDLVIYSKHI